MKASERIRQQASEMFASKHPGWSLASWGNAPLEWLFNQALEYIDELEVRVVALEKAKVDGGK